MEKFTFLEYLPILIKFKLFNNFSNFFKKRNNKINKKIYKDYISLIKQYRYLGVFPYKTIKFFKIK